MQPITQTGFDPKLNDIRHLRAEQRLDGVIDCFGPSILYRGTTRAPASMHGLQKANGEDRNRTTYKSHGKLALRYHARREIRRAPISLFVTTRNTIHRDQLATSLQPDLQGHEFKTDPNLQGHNFDLQGQANNDTDRFQFGSSTCPPPATWGFRMDSGQRGSRCGRRGTTG